MPPKRKTPSKSLPLCEYGRDCYRKNPLHLKKFSHDFPSDDEEVTTPIVPKSKAAKTSAAATASSSPAKKSSRQADKAAAASAAAAKTAAKEAKIGKWILVDGSALVLTHSSIAGSDKIVGFDMDDTLIKTKSGNTFAASRTDWKWFSPEVPKKLKKLNADGYKIVIFTNQMGICGKKGWNSAKEAEIKGKIEDIVTELGIDVQAFIATSDDQFRKPQPTMFDLLIDQYNDGVEPNLADCTYVGDAAGRGPNWKPKTKKDFSASDRKFAFNAGLTFATPEAFFDGEPEAPFEWRSLDPRQIKGAASICDGGVASLTASNQELVLCVGWPGCGKSTLAKKYLESKGYVWVNQDTLKTAPKCLKAVREALAAGKSCVVDNTNPSAVKRQDYIIAALEACVPVRCFRFTASRALAEHLNMFRERMTKGERRHVPQIAYNMYNKNLQEPDMKEGFTEIKKINFVLDFENERAKKLFYQFS